MLKTLPPALLLWGVLVISDALALGVGDITVRSALNQKLDAEIELLSSVPGELDELTVQLASPQAFERIRLERPPILNDIEFEVTTRPNGLPIIKLSSGGNIREPFLSFLIEVNWAKGRMLREYTVLLDPPVTVAAQPAPANLAAGGVAVDRPPPALGPSPGTPGAPTPARLPPLSRGEGAAFDAAPPPPPGPARRSPVAPTARAAPGTAPRITPGATPSPPPVIRRPPPPPAATPPRALYQDAAYGPIARRETLWEIATRVRPVGVSVQQMLLALYDSNPQAFIRGDIHLVKQGHTLVIPDAATARLRDQRTALAQVRAANARLRARQQAVGAPAVAQTSPIAEPAAATAAATTAPTPAPAAARQRDELSLLTPANAAPTDGEGAAQNVSALRRELALTSEAASTLRLENEELKSRVQELEAVAEDVDALKRMLEVQNAEMAKLQSRLADGDGAQTAPAAAPSTPQTAAAPAAPPPPPPPPPPEGIAGYIDAAIGFAGAALDSISRSGLDPTVIGVAGAVVLVLIALAVLIKRRRESAMVLDFDSEESYDEAAQRTQREGLAAGREKILSARSPQSVWSDDGLEVEDTEDAEPRPVLETGAAADDTAAEAEAPPEFDLGDLGLPTTDATQTAGEEESGTAPAFDLSELGLEPPGEATTEEAAATDADIDSVDLTAELAATAADEPAADATDAAQPTEASAGVDLSDFSFDVDESPAAGATAAADAEALTAEDTEAAPAEASGQSLALEPAEAPAEVSEQSLALEMDAPPAESDAEVSTDADADTDTAEISAGDGGGEVSTKMELARAYIDMGDAEGAKNILQEVLAEGDEAQKQQAQELLQKV